jgi:hypothetical protein
LVSLAESQDPGFAGVSKFLAFLWHFSRMYDLTLNLATWLPAVWTTQVFFSVSIRCWRSNSPYLPRGTMCCPNPLLVTWLPKDKTLHYIVRVSALAVLWGSASRTHISSLPFLWTLPGLCALDIVRLALLPDWYKWVRCLFVANDRNLIETTM